ncbi:MAG: ATP-binding protein [Candidatus Omnitrophica bacterium]|nr:ATP-binding protein [Candidatus Omnitrophota bacterium]
MYFEKLLYKGFGEEQIGPIKLNKGLNVIFGRNAVGKTRTLNVMFNLGQMHKNPRLLRKGVWNINLRDSKRQFFYELNVVQSEKTPIVEQDSLYGGEVGENLIFDRNKQLLLNETTNETERYSPISNELSVYYAKDTEKHKTVLEIKDYFSQFKRLDYSLTKVITQSINPESGPLTVSPDGTNLDAAILNIMKGYPNAFENIKRSFREIFPHIEDISPGMLSVANAKLETIFIKEDYLDKAYPWLDASSGMIKILALLSILYSPVEKSLILIDELENSLDYEGISRISDVIAEIGSEKQVIIATHSPILANAFNLKDWIVCKRQDRDTKFYNVVIDNKLKSFLNDNYENYSLYIQDLLHLEEQK